MKMLMINSQIIPFHSLRKTQRLLSKSLCLASSILLLHKLLYNHVISFLLTVRTKNIWWAKRLESYNYLLKKIIYTVHGHLCSIIFCLYLIFILILILILSMGAPCMYVLGCTLGEWTTSGAQVLDDQSSILSFFIGISFPLLSLCFSEFMCANNRIYISLMSAQGNYII